MVQYDRLERQSRLNCEGWLRHHNLVIPPILANKRDRVEFMLDDMLLAWCDGVSLFKLPDGRWSKCAKNGQPAILTPWDAVSNHGTGARRGWRENVARGSCQIIEHVGLIEMDFDIWNPGERDVRGFLFHWAEITANAVLRQKTNPFTVAKLLRDRGMPIEGLD